MHTKQTLLLLLFAVLLLLGCKEKAADEGLSAAPPDTVALNYYNLRAAGRYADYVSAMASCDKATPAYRAHIEKMLRHHTALVQREKGGVSRVEVLRTELHSGDSLAHVYLSVTYNDSTLEEVLFPLVHDGQRWRIQ